MTFIFWFSSAAYSGEPYVKTIYSNKNWKVIEAGLKGEISVREVDSSPFYFAKDHPEYGAIYIKVTENGKMIVAGENIGVYFSSTKSAHVQVDSGIQSPITPEQPTDMPKTIDEMKKGKKLRVNFDFGEQGGIDNCDFNLSGFPNAYRKMMDGKKK